jgi:hypothetical protein
MKISYDFDESLAIPSDLELNGSLWCWGGDDYYVLRPNKQLIEQLLADHAAGHEIFVVSFRMQKDRDEILHFIKENNLPIPEKNVICTDMGPKSDAIKRHGIERHYDDMVSALVEIAINSKCQPIIVVPENFKDANSSNQLFEQFIFDPNLN